jgi:hypothetical protein
MKAKDLPLNVWVNTHDIIGDEQGLLWIPTQALVWRKQDRIDPRVPQIIRRKDRIEGFLPKDYELELGDIDRRVHAPVRLIKSPPLTPRFEVDPFIRGVSEAFLHQMDEYLSRTR